MLELLPSEVGYAVAHSFRTRYGLSSPDCKTSTVTPSSPRLGLDAILHGTTLQPPGVLTACDRTQMFRHCSAAGEDSWKVWQGEAASVFDLSTS